MSQKDEVPDQGSSSSHEMEENAGSTSGSSSWSVNIIAGSSCRSYSSDVARENQEASQLQQESQGQIGAPLFQPVMYNAEDPPVRFRRLIALDHERRIRERLHAQTDLTDRQVDFYARIASYLPGTRYQPLNHPLTHSWTPPRISASSSSDASASPNFLFKDLPAELLPKRKIKSEAASASTSSALEMPGPSHRSPGLVVGTMSPRELSASEDHGGARGCVPFIKTEESPINTHETVVGAFSANKSPSTPTQAPGSSTTRNSFYSEHASPASTASSASFNSLAVELPWSPVSTLDSSIALYDLFEGYVMLCVGPFDELDDEFLVEILKYHGATVIDRAEQFAEHPAENRVVLVGEEYQRNSRNQEAKERLSRELQNCQCVSIDYQWALTSIRLGMKLPLISNYIARLPGVPEELLTDFHQ